MLFTSSTSLANPAGDPCPSAHRHLRWHLPGRSLPGAPDPYPRARSGAPRGGRRHPEAGGCARDLTGPASLRPDAAEVDFAGPVLEVRRLLDRRRKIPRAVRPTAITIHGSTPHPVSARKLSIRSIAPASEPPSAASGMHVFVWASQGTPCPSRVGVFPRVLAPTPTPRP
jgi:hypothetical protein